VPVCQSTANNNYVAHTTFTQELAMPLLCQLSHFQLPGLAPHPYQAPLGHLRRLLWQRPANAAQAHQLNILPVCQLAYQNTDWHRPTLLQRGQVSQDLRIFCVQPQRVQVALDGLLVVAVGTVQQAAPTASKQASRHVASRHRGNSTGQAK
jgi:hypothetical protein